MNDMRKLLSNALPGPEDEPHQRDVIDSAMEWGERRRRRDWALTGAAALAVVAVGAGVAALGTGSGSGRDAPAASGGQQVNPVNPLGVQANGAPFPTAAPSCVPWGVPPSEHDHFCDLWRQQNDWTVEFAKGSLLYIRAALPPGYTVKASDSYVLELTGPDGKTNILFPAATSVTILQGHTPSCAQPGSDCSATSIGGGHAVIGQYPSAGQSAEWVADGLKDPVVLIGVNTVGSPGMGGLPAPTGGPLLSADELERIVSNPGFVQYSKHEWDRSVAIQKEIQKLQGANSSASGGASSSSSLPTNGSASSAPSWPETGSASSHPSGPASSSSSGALSGTLSPTTTPPSGTPRS